MLNANCHFCSIEILIEDTICRKCEIKYSTFIEEIPQKVLV